MNSRFQKLQKLKPVRAEPTPVTQTIIINNPNININYLNDQNKNNGPLSSRGLDNWSLNNNLKEFSQTRQLGFFKKKDRNKSNSPYVIHKVRTQDFRSINKIYVGEKMKETMSNFKKNQTIGHIIPSTIEYQKDVNTLNGSNLEKVMARRDKTMTEKFYQGQVRKNPRIQMLRNFDTLPINHLANPQLHTIQTALDTARTKQFRKGRFEVATDRVARFTGNSDRNTSKQSNQSIESPTKNVRMQEKDDRNIDSGDSEDRGSKKMAPRMNIELRRRAFNRTIAGIDKLLLSNTEDYFDRFHGEKLPQSQIQLCVNSLNYPERVGQSKQKSSKKDKQEYGQYDFMFEQEKKKRPRTPKRKKMYEGI